MSKLANKMFVIQSKGLGGGDPQLASKMMRGFLKMTAKQEIKPNTIFFMGDGVHLMLKDSPVLEFLLQLEEANVELLACRAALEWYHLEESLAVGKIGSTGIWLERMGALEVITF